MKKDHTTIAWKMGDPESTARVAAQIGVSVDAMNKMADNFRRTRLPWESGRVD